MERKYPHLCAPIRIGSVIFRNRMWSAPMGGTDITKDGCIGPMSRSFYELRSKGGAGAVTVSECMVHPATDGSHAYHLDLSVPGSLAGMTMTADAIRRHGAIPSLELSHSGQFAGTYMTDKKRQKEMVQYGVSPSVRADGMEIRPLSREQIKEIVRAYGEVAANAKRAGFEMLMVHGGHGWLINQFLSPLFNKRSDEYGGPLENRTRFAIEVLTAVREAVGPMFPIEFRMSGDEFCEGGYDIEEGIRIAAAVEPYCDIIHVSAGTYQKTFGITHPSSFEEHGRNVYLAAEIKKHVKKPVATLGGLTDPAAMEEIIASGKADICYMGRQLLADPFLPRKVFEGRDDEIRHCLRCFVCMAERAATSTRRCCINPVIGRESDGTEIVPAPVKKRVLVVGGGPGGLEAALTAAKRGHEVILCDENDEPGGILRSEQGIKFKYEMYQLGITQAAECVKAGVDIRLNTRVTPEYARNERADAIIIAVGSEPVISPMPGLADGENVIIVNDLYRHKERLTDDVVVFGGGLAGCEAAVHLGMEGRNVSIVEMRDELAPDANVRYRPLLLEQIEKHVTVHTGCRGIEVTGNGIICEDKGGARLLVPGSTVICALGQRPRSAEAEELMSCAPWAVCIGDCTRASTITNAVYQGYHAAYDI